MGVGSGKWLTASIQEAAHVASEGSWLDRCKAVVLVLPQWWEDVLREVNWSWKGGVHLGQYSSEAGMTNSWSAPGSASLESPTELGGCD